jgi:arabinan endo-1,5-alpha-L-arabinosidase
LKTPSWQDLGIVVQSYGGSTEINAIDPALFRDQDGKVYLSYGSFFGGIGVAEIDQATGKLAGSVTTVWGGAGRDIEAPYITRDGGYYYLFVNRGSCCHGVDSTYYVEVQRATNILGPYSGTRTILPVTDGKYRGPGHIGDLRQDGCHFVSTHYYDLTDNGNPKLDIQRMTYSAGWPVLTRNFTDFAGCGGVSDGVYAFKSRLSGKVMGVAGVRARFLAIVYKTGRSLPPSMCRGTFPKPGSDPGFFWGKKNAPAGPGHKLCYELDAQFRISRARLRLNAAREPTAPDSRYRLT